MIKRIEDKLGFLLPVSLEQFAFIPKRLFLVGNVPEGTTRGEHAHKSCHQILICVSGKILCETVNLNGSGESKLLDHENNLCYIPPMTWGKQTYLSGNSMLLVLTSHEYDEDDYIRDFEVFLVDN